MKKAFASFLVLIAFTFMVTAADASVSIVPADKKPAKKEAPATPAKEDR